MQRKCTRHEDYDIIRHKDRQQKTRREGRVEKEVEYRGVEPLTYRLRTYRSSQLS